MTEPIFYMEPKIPARNFFYFFTLDSVNSKGAKTDTIISILYTYI